MRFTAIRADDLGFNAWPCHSGSTFLKQPAIPVDSFIKGRSRVSNRDPFKLFQSVADVVAETRSRPEHARVVQQQAQDTRPTCSACGSTKVGTLAKEITKDTTWRCAACGETFKVQAPKPVATPRGYDPPLPEMPLRDRMRFESLYGLGSGDEAAQLPSGAKDVMSPPLTSGWQRCPHCDSHGWITRVPFVRGERVIDVWHCENCRHESIDNGDARVSNRS